MASALARRCSFYFVFFSSRRRHTRSLCDWSSDVCSSDLNSGSPPVNRIYVGLGVRKIRLTGGEPLLRKNIERLVEQLASLPGVDLTLTTNGALRSEERRVGKEGSAGRGRHDRREQTHI